MRRALLALVFVAGLLTLTQAPCAACSCVVRTPAQMYDEASVVITGEILATSPADSLNTAYVVRVSRVYKGARIESLLQFTSPASAAACGIEHKVGDRGLWFLDSGNRVAVCSSEPLSEAVDLPVKGHAPVPVTVPTPTKDRPSWPYLVGTFVGAAVGATLITVIAFLVLKRRARKQAVPQA